MPVMDLLLLLLLEALGCILTVLFHSHGDAVYATWLHNRIGVYVLLSVTSILSNGLCHVLGTTGVHVFLIVGVS